LEASARKADESRVEDAEVRVMVRVSVTVRFRVRIEWRFT